MSLLSSRAGHGRPHGRAHHTGHCLEGHVPPRPFETAPGPCRGLPPKPELLENLTVALDFGALEVFEESAPLADQAQQATAGVVVLDVGLEVVSQPIDSLREERDLYLGRAGVAFVTPVPI